MSGNIVVKQAHVKPSRQNSFQKIHLQQPTDEVSTQLSRVLEFPTNFRLAGKVACVFERGGDRQNFTASTALHVADELCKLNNS